MYNITFEVRGFDKNLEKDDGTSWGLFHNEACAKLMWETVSKKFGSKTNSFYVKEINPKLGNVLNGLTGIDRKFKEAELDAEFNAQSDFYEQEENQIW